MITARCSALGLGEHDQSAVEKEKAAALQATWRLRADSMPPALHESDGKSDSHYHSLIIMK
jgi:hypothetical protein